MALSHGCPGRTPYPFMCGQNAVALKAYPLRPWSRSGHGQRDVHEGLNAGMWTVGLTESGNDMGVPKPSLRPWIRTTPGTPEIAKIGCDGRSVISWRRHRRLPANIEEIKSRLVFWTGRRPMIKKIATWIPTASRQSLLLLTPGPLVHRQGGQGGHVSRLCTWDTTKTPWCGESGPACPLAVRETDRGAHSGHGTFCVESSTARPFPVTPSSWFLPTGYACDRTIASAWTSL
jgi:hypothetical protein